MEIYENRFNSSQVNIIMSSTSVQLSFQFESQEIINYREIQELKKSLDKNRKSLHAKNGNLVKEIDAINQKLDILIKAICSPEKQNKQMELNL